MPPLHRRSFLRRSGALAAAPLIMGAAPKGATATLVLDGDDAIAAARPVAQAMHALQIELNHAGYTVKRAQTPQQAAGLCILAAGSMSPVAAGALASARVAQPSTAESLALFEATVAGHPAVVACAADARGLTYALYELADRVRCGAALKFPKPVVEQPANAVRSIMRQFVSELYDKPWFYDRTMWPQYLGMLAAHRFNRFQLCFGLGEDMLRHVQDQYFLFTYPFLVAVPGYDVKVTNLSDAERAKNLATLRFISEQTAAAGLDFELGLWMHGYEWRDTPDPRYVVTGLNKDNHGAFCRDALAALLKALPAVSSVALRIHGESGVAEGSYDFWKTVFDGVPQSGRKIEIDLHAKGIDDKMLANALATGMPVNVAPKFAAEHMGLPYHQADIRPTEIPTATSVGQGLMALSEGQRSFTRYGYADLLRDDRKYTVRTRVFAGTQRLLASGNLEAGAAYAKAFQFCGMTGAELMEPLTCRGRRGSAVEGVARSGYALAKLEPKYDWQKYDLWYRSFGRTMFDPDSDPEVVHRTFSAADAPLEVAMANASRVLPLVTQAYMPSAACDAYWPEVYWNQPMSGTPNPNPYGDIPAPKVFQNTDALDPQLFLSPRAYVDELLGERSGKYSPLEVAAWLDGFADATETALKASEPGSIDVARLRIDAEIQMLTARFFAAKMRSGVLFALHEKTNDAKALHESLEQYYRARAVWAAIVERAHGVYADDLAVSDRFSERGQWSDKLALIDWDIFECERRRAKAADSTDPRVIAAANTTLQAPKRAALTVTHAAPATFTPKQEVALEIAVAQPLTRAMLWYRRVTQAERWTAVDMAAVNGTYRAGIPAAYTDSPYPLQYYFEFRAAPDKAWLHPGLDERLLNQPYFVLRRA